MVGTTPQVDDPTKPRRFCQLPCPSTDRPFATDPKRGWGEWWRRPIASTDGVSLRVSTFTDQGGEGAGAEATCVGLGAVDAGSAGLAESATKRCSPLGSLPPSFRRGLIPLRRDRVSRQPCSGKHNNTLHYSTAQVPKKTFRKPKLKPTIDRETTPNCFHAHRLYIYRTPHLGLG